jgi:hypothetical protein
VPKTTEEEALGALKKEMEVWCHTPFFVNVGKDDGGSHLQIWIERKSPSERLESWICQMLPGSRYMGRRLIIIKCPREYIRLYITQKKKKDW